MVSEHKRRGIALWIILIVGIVTCESRFEISIECAMSLRRSESKGMHLIRGLTRGRTRV